MCSVHEGVLLSARLKHPVDLRRWYVPECDWTIVVFAVPRRPCVQGGRGNARAMSCGLEGELSQGYLRALRARIIPGPSRANQLQAVRGRLLMLKRSSAPAPLPSWLTLRRR